MPNIYELRVSWVLYLAGIAVCCWALWQWVQAAGTAWAR
jgi:hypothetical protein